MSVVFAIAFLCPLFGCVFLRILQTLMSDEFTPNGAATPVSPKMSGLALTEYTAAPTPPSERPEPSYPPNWGIPDAFLLPNGYPDVRWILPMSYRFLTNGQLVSPTDLDVTSLRCY